MHDDHDVKHAANCACALCWSEGVGAVSGTHLALSTSTTCEASNPYPSTVGTIDVRCTKDEANRIVIPGRFVSLCADHDADYADANRSGLRFEWLDIHLPHRHQD